MRLKEKVESWVIKSKESLTLARSSSNYRSDKFEDSGPKQNQEIRIQREDFFFPPSFLYSRKFMWSKVSFNRKLFTGAVPGSVTKLCLTPPSKCSQSLDQCDFFR